MLFVKPILWLCKIDISKGEVHAAEKQEVGGDFARRLGTAQTPNG
jgi:hypothetical protein